MKLINVPFPQTFIFCSLLLALCSLLFISCLNPVSGDGQEEMARFTINLSNTASRAVVYPPNIGPGGNPLGPSYSDLNFVVNFSTPGGNAARTFSSMGRSEISYEIATGTYIVTVDIFLWDGSANTAIYAAGTAVNNPVRITGGHNNIAIQVSQAGVRITPSRVYLSPGSSPYQFNAQVIGSANQSVIWSLAGGVIDTEINETGLLIIDLNEPVGTSLTVTAISIGDPSLTGTAIVIVVPIGALTGYVDIIGNPWPGETLTADTSGLFGAGAISYQWRRNGADISGATNATYTLAAADSGQDISVAVERALMTGEVESGPVFVFHLLAIGTPSALNRTLTPIEVMLAGVPYSERTATFTVGVSGFTDNAAANNVGLVITGVNGLSFSGYNAVGFAVGGTKTFTITVTYNNIAVMFNDGFAEINITGLTNKPASYHYAGGTQTATANISDGAPGVASNDLTEQARRIPVSQANIQAFNQFANTTIGLNRHYLLTGAVMLAAPAPGGSNWTAIGTAAAPFTGTFDGGINTITGLTINSTESNQGMFGVKTGIVIRLGLIDVSVISSGVNVGAVAGLSRGQVNISFISGTGMIQSTSSGANISHVGGIIGGGLLGDGMWPHIAASYVIGNITVSQPNNDHSQSGTGGIAGYIGTLQRSFATVNVSSANNSGGLVGIIHGGGVSGNYFANGTVTATGNASSAGGVVGLIINDASLRNNYSTGTIINTGTNGFAGGIIGRFPTTGWVNLHIHYNVALNQSVTTLANNNVNVGRIFGGLFGVAHMSVIGNFGRDGMMLQHSGINKSPLDEGMSLSDGGTVFPGTGPGQFNEFIWWRDILLFAMGTWEWNHTTNLPILRDLPGNPPQNHPSP
jgi:hypothetical protein